MATDSENRAVGPHIAWWLILLGLSGWSYMSVWAVNSSELIGFDFVRFGIWVLILLTMAAVIQQGTKALLRGPARLDQSFSVAAVSLVLFQSWDNRISQSLPLESQVAAHGVLSAVVIALTLRLVPAFPAVRAGLGVLVAFLVGAHYLTAVAEAWGELTSDPAAVVRASATDLSGEEPDVFVIVLDGYAGSDALHQAFGFDNSDFETRLSSADLSVVPGAKANYTMSRLSIAGLLDGRYPVVGGSEDSTFNDIAEIHSGNNALFASLRAAGYETHLYDNAWSFTHCGRNVDKCHTGGLNEFDHFVLSRSPLVDLVPWLQVSPWARDSLSQFEHAIRFAAIPSDKPRLVYLHALVPHAPLQLNADCSVRSEGIGSIYEVIDSSQARVAYVRQVRCVNSMVADLVEAAPSDSIFFITGDHGVRWVGDDTADGHSRGSETLTTRSIITAYRFPDRCPVVPSAASLMQAAGELFRCLGISFNGHQDYDPSQPDRYFSHATRSSGSYRIADRTSVVSEIQG